jgi:hypothetical protein
MILDWIEKAMFFRAEDIVLKWRGITLDPKRSPASYEMDERESLLLTPKPTVGSSSEVAAATSPMEQSEESPGERIRVRV